MANRLLVATRKGLFDFRRHANGQWRVENRSFLGEPVTMVLRDHHDATLYAALELGHFGTKLHRSDDEGQSWEEVAVPSYADIAVDEGKNEGPSLKLIWSLALGAPGTLWAGTIPGGLFKSVDRGQTWSLCQSLWNDPLRQQWFGGGYDEPGIHSICVDPRDSNRIVVAVSCGGVWCSQDAGETWRIVGEGLEADYLPPDQAGNLATQDPHCMVRCSGSPDTFWIQHHCGIFKSIDGAENWTRIHADPSSFGFAVAVHPQRPETAWFVPAIKDEKRYPVDGQFVVTRTEDGGDTFAAFDSGLPSGESYDLVFRHGLAVDDTGECLAMASTTGNLWISEQGGEHWELLSNYLPPVYALTFI